MLLYNLKLNCLMIFFSTGLNSSLIIFIRTYIVYCKLSKCIGQTPRSYEHYLVLSRLLMIMPLTVCVIGFLNGPLCLQIVGKPVGDVDRDIASYAA